MRTLQLIDWIGLGANSVKSFKTNPTWNSPPVLDIRDVYFACKGQKQHYLKSFEMQDYAGIGWNGQEEAEIGGNMLE